MKHKHLRYYIMIAIFIIAMISSAIAIIILPNSFLLRFNTASNFHQASSWELFVVPFMIPVSFICIEILYKKYYYEQDMSRKCIAAIASIIVPLIGLLYNFKFIFESLNRVSKNELSLTSHPQNWILLVSTSIFILLGVSLILYFKNKEKKSKNNNT